MGDPDVVLDHCTYLQVGDRLEALDDPMRVTIVVYLPFFNKAFTTTPLAPSRWLICTALAGTVLWASEFRKLILRHLDRQPKRPHRTVRRSDPIPSDEEIAKRCWPRRLPTRRTGSIPAATTRTM